MKPRLNANKTAPEAMKAVAALEGYVLSSGLEPALIDLVKTRAWRESPLYTERERAALAWTEALTLVAQTHVPDEVYDEARRQFSEEELVKLTVAVATINAWNRIAISFRSVHPVRTANAA